MHPIRTTQLAISRFANSRKPKSVIHVSSIAGQNPAFVTPVYVASKHAINGFVRSLAKLDTIGIRVTAVAPGFIKTPLWTEHPEKMQIVDESKNEWVTPEQVAKVMLAVLQQDRVDEHMIENPNKSGEQIPINGGTVLEISKTVRAVSPYNDPGPIGRPGNSMGNTKATEEGFLSLVQSGNWGKPGSSKL